MNGFRPGHEPQQVKGAKPSVQVCCLCGTERQNWINPALVGTLISMTHDSRFSVTIEMVSDLRGFDSARNHCVDSARKRQADWLVMFDNDIAPRISPLEMIEKADSDMWVVGMVYGCFQRGTIALAGDGQSNPQREFFEMAHVGTGCIAIKSRVWQKLAGPWFKWLPTQDELLSPGTGEDIYFSNLCRANDIKLWAHRQAAQHLRTFDITTVLCGK